MSDSTRQAYGLVRQHLKVAVERNKRICDLRVRPEGSLLVNKFAILTHLSPGQMKTQIQRTLLGDKGYGTGQCHGAAF